MGSHRNRRRLEAKKRKSAALSLVSETVQNSESVKRAKLQARPAAASSQELLSPAELEELRAKLRQRKNRLKHIPDLRLNAAGQEADIDMPDGARKPLLVKDLHEFLLYSLLGSKAPIDPSRWCKFIQWNKLSKVLFVVMQGVGVSDFRLHRDTLLDRVRDMLCVKLEFVSCDTYGSHVVDEICMLPLSSAEKDRLIRTYGDLDSVVRQKCQSAELAVRQLPSKLPPASNDLAGSSAPLKLRLLLSIEQLIEEGYPLKASHPTYLNTKEQYSPVTEKSPLFSIDCEMVLTSARKNELARICVVDQELNVVYESLVKPANPIIDYLTQYSGITEELLGPVDTTLQQVQADLQHLLPPDAILVGQSLNSDLQALEMTHPYVIDTSVIYCLTGDRRRKSKLSVLAKAFLGSDIQMHEANGRLGHDPKEDAITAMRLVLKKLSNGYDFGDVLLNSGQPGAPLEPTAGALSTESVVCNSIFSRAYAAGPKQMCLVGSSDCLKSYRKYSQFSEDQKQVVVMEESSSKAAMAKACQVSSSFDLTICHLEVSRCSDGQVTKSMKRIQRWMQKLWSSTATNGLFVTLWSGDSHQNALVGLALNKATID